MKFKLHWLAAAAAASLLSACGGGDGTLIHPVKVAGDSLADSGTFGIKFTVQGSAATGTGSTPIWPELIAQDNFWDLCPHYTATSASTFAANDRCTNYAVSGGRINALSAPGSPLSITQQLIDMGANGLNQDDLVLIDGGGHDVADLIRNFLAASTDQGAAFATLLDTVLPPATVQPLLSQGQAGLVQAGALYMQALATQYASTITVHIVNKGAGRVVVLNMPDVTLTPQFSAVLGAIAQNQGQDAAAQLQQVFGGWVQAFNTTLLNSFKGSKVVAIADFDSTLKAMVAQPANYGLSNVKTPACPVTSTDGSGLAQYNLPTCTAAALSAETPPAGAAADADWWKIYLFSDAFHPTPRGHELIANMVRALL